VVVTDYRYFYNISCSRITNGGEARVYNHNNYRFIMALSVFTHVVGTRIAIILTNNRHRVRSIYGIAAIGCARVIIW